MIGNAIFVPSISVAVSTELTSIRIEKYTVGLAQQLYEGLVKQHYRMFTPPGNGSSIVTCYFTRRAEDFREAFRAAKIDVTVRGSQLRVSPALFNNADEIDRLLEITSRLA